MPPIPADAHLTRLIATELVDLPWYRSLYGNLREVIRPPRLPPLQVTSHPVAVKDIWGLYGRQKKSFAMSVGFQAALLTAVVLAGLSNSRVPRDVGRIIQHVYWDPPMAVVPRTHPSAALGGGSGGTRSPLPASPGVLAQASPRKYVPPEAVPNNTDPKLPMKPTIVMIEAPDNDPSIKPYGDPWARNGPPSDGPGYGGGIGDNCCGGQGPGHGPGAGPGPGGPGVFSGPVFTSGHSGLVNPVALFKPEPDYSEDARKAKLQGTVVLEVMVDANGNPHVQKVLQSLGLGLDDQATKAVSTWRFKPGRFDGKPVPVLIHVYVSFRLL